MDLKELDKSELVNAYKYLEGIKSVLNNDYIPNGKDIIIKTMISKHIQNDTINAKNYNHIGLFNIW